MSRGWKCACSQGRHLVVLESHLHSHHSWLVHPCVLAAWVSNRAMIQHRSGRDFDFSFGDRVYFLDMLQGVLCSGVEDEQALPSGAWVQFWQGIRDTGTEGRWTLPFSDAGMALGGTGMALGGTGSSGNKELALGALGGHQEGTGG